MLTFHTMVRSKKFRSNYHKWRMVLIEVGSSQWCVLSSFTGPRSQRAKGSGDSTRRPECPLLPPRPETEQAPEIF